MMGSNLTNASATPHAKMDGSMAEEDQDFEPQSRTAEEIRKFMDIRKSVRLSAG